MRKEDMVTGAWYNINERDRREDNWYIKFDYISSSQIFYSARISILRGKRSYHLPGFDNDGDLREHGMYTSISMSYMKTIKLCTEEETKIIRNVMMSNVYGI